MKSYSAAMLAASVGITAVVVFTMVLVFRNQITDSIESMKTTAQSGYDQGVSRAKIAAALDKIGSNAQSASAGQQESPRGNYKLAWESEAGFETPDPEKIYKPGEEIKIEQPHGVHRGVLEMDTVYFVAVDKLPTSSKRCAADCVFTGSIEAHVRHAISPSWKRMNFTFWCTQPPPEPGQVAVARVDPNFEHLRIGEYEGHCELSNQ